MSDFIKGTKDLVEQLYGEQVSKNLPNYGAFWVKFIGDPKKDVPMPYGLNFSKASHGTNIAQINPNYEELCMAHYSLFCHLSGAHFQLELLKESLGLPESNTRSFKHWEAFETGYIHLGSAFYQMYHLWGLIFLLKGIIKRKNGRFVPGPKKNLESIFKAEDKRHLTIEKPR